MSHHRLTPRMRTLLASVARSRQPAIHTLTPVEARSRYGAMAEVLDLPRVPLARVETLEIPTHHRCAARLYASRPAEISKPLPVLLYLHGGGFVLGGLETHDSLCRQIALRSGVAVLALDYRLAPEHRFPAAVEDVWAALQWLINGGATSLGLDSTRVALGGDSAGATLAAVAALMARDADLPLALQLLITPGTAADLDSASHQRFGEGFLIDRALLDWFFDHYIDPEQRRDWRYAPLHAEDLEGVAPAYLVLAECDPLVDEGLAYADRLRMAAVAVELDLVKGVTHDFIKMGRVIEEAIPALDRLAAALQQALRT
ncbi:alpha/beta hydrolase [Leptothrix ochracea]|uniref:alpha/beta hydrolase n=2 Tax=Leptothrix ochracea TaxID=735331 RepID=UPI0034E1B6BD